VSNDNPYSESQFKTLKYSPAFPERFGSIHDARAFCERFLTRYNDDHRHSGIAYHTPASVPDPCANDRRQGLASLVRLLARGSHLAGDVNAVRRGRVGRRIARRAAGKATGRAMRRLFE